MALFRIAFFLLAHKDAAFKGEASIIILTPSLHTIKYGECLWKCSSSRGDIIAIGVVIGVASQIIDD